MWSIRDMFQQPERNQNTKVVFVVPSALIIVIIRVIMYVKVIKEVIVRVQVVVIVVILEKNVKEVKEETNCETYFEWPKNNDGWKHPKLEELMRKLPYSAEFDGCAYGLKNSEGKSMKKSWKVTSTHERIQEYVNKTCTCAKEHKSRSEASSKAIYRGRTRDTSKKWTRSIRQSL